MIAFADAEQTPEQRFERLLDLPPSAKLVFRVLQDETSLTQQQLRERALLPPRTVREALTKLEDADLVEERVYVPDARKRLYVPRPVSDSGNRP